LAGVLIAVLIVVVALCWVLPDEDPSQRLVQIIHARRVGRARAARADAKRWAAQPDNGHGFAAGTPEPRDWGTGDKGSYHLVKAPNCIGCENSSWFDISPRTCLVDGRAGDPRPAFIGADRASRGRCGLRLC